MVIWTVPQRDTITAPTFSLSGVFLSWPDGAPAVLRQTAFTWQDDAWQACVEVSSPAGESRVAYGIIRLKPSVVAAWEIKRVNPRREAASQLGQILRIDRTMADLGTVTLRSS
jgi:hypothetical protein